MDESIQRRVRVVDKYAGLVQLMGTYWVLAVVGAFLLVILTGDPGFLKTVYLVWFFYLIMTYQVHTYMYVCVYVCIYVCMYVCVYVCIYVCMYVCIYVCVYVCNVCMYVCVYA